MTADVSQKGEADIRIYEKHENWVHIRKGLQYQGLTSAGRFLSEAMSNTATARRFDFVSTTPSRDLLVVTTGSIFRTTLEWLNI